MWGCLSASVAGGGVAAAAPGPDHSGAGKETHAAALQVLDETRNGPHTTEGSLLLYRKHVSILWCDLISRC